MRFITTGISAIATALVVSLTAIAMSYFTNYWFPWLVIVGGQVPDACIAQSAYVSDLLTPVDASCPPGDAAAEGGPDASTD